MTLDRSWPALSSDADDTYRTIHLWSQIIGKIRLAHMPWINHSWHVPLYVNARGLTTALMPARALGFEIELDLCDHHLSIFRTDGQRRSFPLEPMPVSEFYARTLDALSALEMETRIWTMPVEIPGPVTPFDHDDLHTTYDAAAVTSFWQALVQIERVFTQFRSGFLGKVSPVHFFWGAFDLAVTRFSGRTAPLHPGGAPNVSDSVMREAYSHEVSSAGFWPALELGGAAFYSYAYPEPEGFATYRIKPDAAYYHPELREFVLPYEAVRTAADPDATLIEFLQGTYEAAADLGHWDRRSLERN